MNGISDEQRVKPAPLFLGEMVDTKYQGRLFKNKGLEWDVLLKELSRRSRGADWRDFIREFNKLVQTGKVLEYQDNYAGGICSASTLCTSFGGCTV